MYYIPHNYAILQVMPRAIPQTHATFTLTILSVLQNPLVIPWWRNETIEMHLCSILIGLEKLKFDEIMSVL